MGYTLQQFLPNFAFDPSKKRSRSTISFRIHCTSEFSKQEKEGFEEESHVVLVERFRNGTSKRYVIDGNSKLQTFLEERKSVTNESQFSSSSSFNNKVSWLPDNVKVFVLPSGFPGSVSDDYLEYMLFQLPTNITGWICSILVTSSLLKAVGVGSFSGTSAAATAAAIRWVSKDGLGTLGRFFIGGRFGDLFDNDPKQWRMYADFIGSAGSIFDLTTPLFPAYFLPLASLGNLTKAVARGLRDPSFRVIQNHFAISGNLGEVAAKEEVWEVTAQLIGLGLGVLLLDSPGIQTSYTTLTLTWLSMRLLHLLLRYQSLSALVFNTINLKRARMLAKSHVLHSVVPGYVDCNKKENILSWQKFLKPSIIFGVSLEEIIDGERSVAKVKALLQLYKGEQYILVVNQQLQTEFQVFISFKVKATGLSVLRSIWQTYWLHEHWQGSASSNVFDLLQASISKLDTKFDDFLQQLEEAGWDVKQIKLKVPAELLFEEMHTT